MGKRRVPRKVGQEFDYQLDRHCSKTVERVVAKRLMV